MAQYNVTYLCGHKEIVRLFGPGDGRRAELARLGRLDCPNCYKKRRDAEHKAEAAEAAIKAQDLGLPQLVGSEKQIVWAESLRAAALASPTNTLIPEDKAVLDTPEKKGLYDIAKAARKQLETEILSKWWIDNRSNLCRYVVQCMADARNDWFKGLTGEEVK